MHWLRSAVTAEAGRLLRVLLLRLGALSTDAERALWRAGRCFVLHGIEYGHATIQPSRDWLASRGSSVLGWWIPHAAILAGLFVPTPIRVVIWTIALILMGAA